MHEHTRSRVLPALAASLLSVLAITPLAAQEHRAALGLTGGWATHGDLTPGLGFTTEFEPGWMAGLQIETWPGSGRVGLRLDGSYSERPLAGDPDSDFNIYAADVDLLIRLLPAGRSRLVAPYIAIGAGAAHYNAGNDRPLAGSAYGDDPATRAVAMAGFGLDFGAGNGGGLRIEFADRVVLPGIGEGPDEMDPAAVSHNLQLQAAMQVHMGRIPRPMVVAAATRPAPAAPAVAAEPAVAPAEVAELRDNIGRMQSRVGSLTQRVDSLERALERTRATALAAQTAARTAAEQRPVGVAEVQATRSMASTDGLYTVQIGAFVEKATATRWAERLRGRNLPVWVTDVVIRGQRVSRVRVGALPTLREARALGDTLKAEYGWPVWVDHVATEDQVPQGAVAATLAFMR